MTNNSSITKQVFVSFVIILLMVSCTKKKPDEEGEVVVFEYEETIPEPSISSLVGVWQLDSVVFVTDSVRGNPQIPFSLTTWSFTEEGSYVVSAEPNQLELSVLENDSVEQATSLVADTPAAKYTGRYQHSADELITTILGGDIKYHIAHQSGTTLHLSSQRVQVVPTKEDYGKLAEHYFTLVQP